MIREADTTGNGEVSEEEFIKVMMQTNLFKGTQSDLNSHLKSCSV